MKEFKRFFRLAFLILITTCTIHLTRKHFQDQAQVGSLDPGGGEKELYHNFDNFGLREKEYPLEEFKVNPKACEKVLKLGSSANHWAVCASRIQKPCRILSFGVGFDYSFDKEANKRFGCEIFLFDPTPAVVKSMSSLKHDHMHFYPWGLASKTLEAEFIHNWWNQRELAKVQMFSFEDILEKLNMSFAPIIKLDIEGYEFEVIQSILKLTKRYGVEQILVELHYGGIVNDDFRQVNGGRGGGRWIEIFRLFKQSGFEIFWKLRGRYDTKSKVCKKDSSSQTCYRACFEDISCKGALQEYGFIRTQYPSESE